MKTTHRLVMVAVALGISFTGAGAGWAQEVPAAVTQRQDAMKAKGKSLAAIKAFTEGKGDLAAAQAASAQLASAMPNVPKLFPQQTSSLDYPGKSYAKPEIWTQWDRFNETVRAATAKAQAFDSVMRGGDKAAITTAFATLGKEACGACHGTFRQKKETP